MKQLSATVNQAFPSFAFPLEKNNQEIKEAWGKNKEGKYI